jgi:hypothetical protein
MKKKLRNPLKCSVCGKFISYREVEEGKVLVEFTPDTEFTSESTEFTHEKCLKINK